METTEAKLPRLLLVDDNETVRKTLGIVLEMNQFDVTAAASVSEALHLIDTETFDVLLSDPHAGSRRRAYRS